MMGLGFAVVALFAGLVLLAVDAESARFLVGATLVALAAWSYRLREQVRAQTVRMQALELRLNGLSHRLTAPTPQPDQPADARGAAPGSAPSEPTEAAAHAAPSGRSHHPDVASASPRPPEASLAPPRPAPAVGPTPRVKTGSLSSTEKALRWLRRWLTTGNVPVKMGVLISFFGVSFLLKYAADQNYLTLPVSWRLAGVAMAATGALWFGWRQRERRPAFALALQGGAIGLLFLTVFAAFQLYQLLPALPAFGLLVLFTLVAGGLALRQNAMALAVLGAVGGFLAPVLISTGGGSHVALFSYYALLNGAVFATAWLRPWRVLNLIGFAFTFVVGVGWGYEFYHPAYFASVQPFLLLFFALYVGISIAYALGRSFRLRSYVDGTLVFGLPLLVYPLQTRLVGHFEHGATVSALALATIYLAAAWALSRASLKARVGLLAEAFLALGVGFATLAVPLMLSAHWTSVAWALEGVAMVWLGCRQGRALPAAAGVGLQLLGGGVLLGHLLLDGSSSDRLLLNQNVLGGVVLALAGVASAYWLERRSNWFRGFAAGVSWLLFAWGLLWWLIPLAEDVAFKLDTIRPPATTLLVLAVTAALLRGVQRLLVWSKIRAALSGYLPLLLLLAISWFELGAGTHFLAQGGIVSWPLALSALAMVFWGGEGLLPASRPWQRAGTVWLITFLVARQVYWLAGQVLPLSIWPLALTLAVPVLGYWALWFGVQRNRLAMATNQWDWLVRGGGPLLALAATAVLMAVLTQAGRPAPLAYWPLLNPLSSIAVAVWLTVSHGLVNNGLLAWQRYGFTGAQWRWLGLAGLGFVLLSSEVSRTVHHWSAVPFRAEALFESVRVQAGLSMVWALCALAVMVFSHRRAMRPIYLMGAALMALVVAKLFLIDLAQSGTLERIVSFLGVGVLLLVVGFLAPVPPKRGPGAG